MKTDIAKMLEKPMKTNDFSWFLSPILHQVDPTSPQVRPTWPQVGSSRPQVDGKLAQVGFKTAQEGPRCGHAGQIFVSLEDSHSSLEREPQWESNRVAGG